MRATDLTYRAIQGLAALSVFTVLVMPAVATAQDASRVSDAKPPCNPTIDQVKMTAPLKHVAQKIALGEPVTIVALGSSSTAGAGATSQLNNYPNQLALDLQQRFPGQAFTVLNRGVNGEEVPDMLKRFDSAVMANKPDLLLWQLGTNSLIRDHNLNEPGSNIRVGLDKVRAIGADVVLIDPQYAPKVIEKPLVGKMVEFIASTAKQENVALFRRFEVMKRWVEADNMPFTSFVIADGLHMNDWGYQCMAKGLGMAIAEAASRNMISAKASVKASAKLPVVSATAIVPTTR
ncbi:MAG: SGNH/GDSL hydrolase family protein [Pseudolabrys sp.]|nr:SGNH/GDSL hydrolase family protein [Pseudolabrys sp.]